MSKEACYLDRKLYSFLALLLVNCEAIRLRASKTTFALSVAPAATSRQAKAPVTRSHLTGSTSSRYQPLFFLLFHFSF